MQLDPEMFDPVCPSGALPFRIGDKWTAMIVLCLENGPARFTELRVPLKRISPKVLTETLKAMERDGLVTRTAFDENPPRVEYELTALGRSLLALIGAVREWSSAHLADLLAHRERSPLSHRPGESRLAAP
ncbi:helix-turn-helix domain-containing protein [Actinosynnema sp. NPDC020468]|uniref:winged helix-turn-helix transcriptional regulator n=1 Tax=Actinosynnema sp. NPDC020468 TaxID=3154488 RepID=UPI0033C1E145